MGNKFEQRMSSRAFWFFKMIADLLITNFLFVIVSVCSLFVLFFPGLVSLTSVVYKIVNHQYYHPFTTFFSELKNQWSFMWRLEVLGMSIIAISAVVGYGYYAYIINVGYDWLIWVAIIFMATVILVVISLFIHLLIFNEYFKDDTFKMMIRKAAVIARKKIWQTLLMMAFLICFVAICFIVPYLIPFVPFSALAFINLHLTRETYGNLVLEEEKRMAIPENLFLPTKVEDKNESR